MKALQVQCVLSGFWVWLYIYIPEKPLELKLHDIDPKSIQDTKGTVFIEKLFIITTVNTNCSAWATCALILYPDLPRSDFHISKPAVNLGTRLPVRSPAPILPRKPSSHPESPSMEKRLSVYAEGLKS